METFNIDDYFICKGAFADVLINLNDKRAFKLFKSYDHPDLDGTGKEAIGKEQTNAYRRKVFLSENEAYQKAQASEILKVYTPKYFGKTDIDKIFENAIDVSSRYLADCCFEIEYIDGDEIKLNLIKGNNSLLTQLQSDLKFNLSVILNEFNHIGITYTKDSSAIFNDKHFTIIDFAMIDPSTFEPIIDLGDNIYGKL